MKTTTYFEQVTRQRHPECNRTDWVQAVLDRPVHTETQANGRVRHWGFIEEVRKWMRVVLEPDRETVHNAFFDTPFGRRIAREEQERKE